MQHHVPPVPAQAVQHCAARNKRYSYSCWRGIHALRPPCSGPLFPASSALSVPSLFPSLSHVTIPLSLTRVLAHLSLPLSASPSRALPFSLSPADSLSTPLVLLDLLSAASSRAGMVSHLAEAVRVVWVALRGLHCKAGHGKLLQVVPGGVAGDKPAAAAAATGPSPRTEGCPPRVMHLTYHRGCFQ